MVVRIRLVRMGRVREPIYNIVVSQNKIGLQRKPIEVLGTYDAVPKAPAQSGSQKKLVKEIHLDFERARYWLGVGAQPTETVSRLFEMFGILPEKKKQVSKK
ncbi:ribosomal protein S16 [Dipodascopsis uninucleata]